MYFDQWPISYLFSQIVMIFNKYNCFRYIISVSLALLLLDSLSVIRKYIRLALSEADPLCQHVTRFIWSWPALSACDSLSMKHWPTFPEWMTKRIRRSSVLSLLVQKSSRADSLHLTWFDKSLDELLIAYDIINNNNDSVFIIRRLHPDDNERVITTLWTEAHYI